MNLKDLVYFHELVKEQNFTKVAENLQVSQPTVTYALKRLEEDFGSQLIKRSQAHYGIEITEAGKILDKHAVKMLRELNDAKNEIIQLDRPQMAVGLPPIIGNYYFPKISADLIKNKLMDHIRIVSGGSRDIFSFLKKGQIDIAISGSTQPFDDPAVDSELLTTRNFMIVVNKHHRLASRKSVSFTELRDEDFVLLNEHFIHPEGFNKLAQQALFAPHVVYKNNDLNILKGMIKEGVGIGFLVDIAVNDGDDLVKIPISDAKQPQFFISLVQQKNAQYTDTEQMIINFFKGYKF